MCHLPAKSGEGYDPRMMDSSENSAALHQSQKERKHRRFDLRFPVSLSFPAGGSVRKLEAISENVSIGGLLLKAGDRVPPRTRVNLTMDVKGPRFRNAVRLVAQGRVVRVEALGSAAGFAIAVECQRPITEMRPRRPDCRSEDRRSEGRRDEKHSA